MEKNKTYTYDEVYSSTLNYFNGDDLATNVWVSKYCKSELTDDGQIIYYEKNPDDMFHRIASEISRAGMKYENPLSEEEVYELIKDYKHILFAGRPMAGIGVDDAVSISNCFVVGRPGQDSYGTIATIDQEIMQLSKRGGGCVWEDTSVIIKDRGIVPIKDVNVGEYILSFNIVNHKDEWKLIKDKYYTDVKLEDQIEVEYSNGTRLKTSKRHPILCLSKEGYGYKSFNDGYSIGSTNKVVTNSEFDYSRNENDNLAWLIGHHIGDGTIGGTNSKNKNRIRIIGDNKEVIEKYAEILNRITGSNSKTKECTQKRYKTKVWEYSSKNDNNYKFIELIDNQVGLKTYTCFIPKIIKDNNLYVPFIAGLIDADGSVDKRKGRIEISICSKILIKEISEYLSFNGQPYHVTVKRSKRNNEKEIYRLVIPNRAPIVKVIRKYLVHPQKIEKLNIISNKLHSKVIDLTNNEIAKIENFKGSNIADVKMRKLFYNNRANCRKRNGKMAVPGLQLCYDLGIFTYEEYNEIASRVNTVNIIDDNSQKLNYIDIEVEDNNNYYAGEYGFVNIHNCGTDLSDFRPGGSKVHNAARTSSGPVEICATRFSNTIREVGQCIDGDAFVIVEGRGMVKIKDVTTNDKVWTHKGFVKVNEVINNGVQKVNTIVTKFGYNINVTDNHIMISCDENGLREEYVSDLKVNDNIVLLDGVNDASAYVELTNNFIPEMRPIVNQCGVVGEMVHNKYKECITPCELDEDLAYFIGVLMGDGYTDKTKTEISISCNKKDEDEINKLICIIRDKFGVEPLIKDCKTYVVIRILRKEIVSFLNENGINKPTCEYLRIPKKIFNSKKSVQGAFLSGLMDSDGSNKKSKGGYQITTVNKEFANDIQLLYSLNGVVSKIHEYTPKNKNWKTKYNVTVIGRHAQSVLTTLLSESIKVANCPFVSKRDGNLTPFTQTSLGCKRVENGVRLNEGYLSLSNLDKLKEKGVYNNGTLIKDSIKTIEDNGEKEVFDLVLDNVNMFWCNGIYVHNCGRRGALMLSMDINHPSAEEFMDAKMEEGKITGANISMKLYDDWMKKALGIGCEMDKEKNRLWKKIIHNATTKAEPGVLFWDTILRESPADCYSDYGFKTISTNPCFPASEYLLTDKGYVKFGDLYEYGENNVVMTDNRISYVEIQEVETPEQWHIDEHNSGVTPRDASNVFLTKKNAEIAELVFTNGSKLRCTPDHHIATLNRGMVEAKDLTSDDKVLVGLGNIGESIKNKMPETTEEILAFLCGLVMGDGCMSINKKQERCHLSFWGEDSLRMTDICVNLINTLFERCGDIKGLNHKSLSKYFITTKGVNGVSKTTITSSYLAQLFKKYFNYTKISKHVVPEYVMNNASTNVGKFFIAGFMYCDGSISGNLNKGISVRLHQSNLELLRQVQMLFNANGFYSTIKLRRKEQMRRMPDGKGGYKEYFTKANYDIIISSTQSEDFVNNIGFFGDINKENKFIEFTKNKRDVKAYTNMLSYTLCEETEDVYCIKEPVTRSIIVNNISTRRCGEIPLAAGDACRLMSLNLYSYVDYPFTSDARFNFEKFIKHAKLSIKLMDNMIDLENEKIDKILSKVEKDPEDEDIKAVEKNLWNRVKRMNNFGRRSGIGFTALGDMLAALGLKYGTVEATQFVEYVQKVMATAVYIGSCDLVQVDNRPTFGCFDYELEKNNPFLNRLTMPTEYLLKHSSTTDYANTLAAEFEKKWKNNLGRRNIALLTCAPAGSLSTQSQTTSGLEPVFMISYRRRRKIDKNSGVKPDFIDKTGDAFIEFNVVHHKFIEWYRIHRNENKDVLHLDGEMSFTEAKEFLEKLPIDKLNEIIRQSPYFGATAMDCDWHERINMQASLQRYVDHSLSVTCNLPKGTSEEVVEDVYRTAWESGCKGCTIYVDGSRDGVLITKDEKKKCECKEFLETTTPKRPKKLPCKIIKFSNKGIKWIAAVGLYEGKPYEIFTGIAEKLNIPNGIDSGYIIRNKVSKDVLNEDTGLMETVKVSRYDIEFNRNGETVMIEGLSTIFNEEYWNYGKLISGLLRHGMPVNYVVKVITSMDFKNDGINSWKAGVIRALKTFMKDEDLHEPCPKCGGHLRRESGCIQCMDCGWSKCGAN